MKNYFTLFFAFLLFANVNCANVEQTKSSEKALIKIQGKIENFEAEQKIQLSTFDPISQVKESLAEGAVDGEGNYVDSHHLLLLLFAKLVLF